VSVDPLSPAHTPRAARPHPAQPHTSPRLPPQVLDWENARLVRRGITADVASAARRALRPLLPALQPAHQRLSRGPASRIGTLAVHARRGDKETKGTGHSSAARYPDVAVRLAIQLAGRAMIATGLFPGGVEVTIHSDGALNATLAGCPDARALPNGLTCRLANGTVLSDLHEIVRSDAFLMSSSSFAVLAYYLREGDRSARPTLIPIPQISQFYAAAAPSKRPCHALLSATNGIPDGSVAGATKPRFKGANCPGKARPHMDAPPHIMFVHHEVEEAVRLATDSTREQSQDDAADHVAKLSVQLEAQLRRIMG
jgi:hypothetical protein